MDGSETHISRRDLIRLLNKQLPEDAENRCRRHLRSCDFCREISENLALQLRIEKESEEIHLTPVLKLQAERIHNNIHRRFMRGLVIELVPLENPALPAPMQLAADSSGETTPKLENLATVYSENPEIVLKFMRDNEAKSCFLQVVSDQPDLFKHVLVEAPELDCSLVTDANGRAALGELDTAAIGSSRWNIRLPEAVFAMESLDPDHTQSRVETVLETDQADRMRVALETKVVGSQIEIELLELRGSAKIGPARLVVELDDSTTLHRLGDNHTLIIDTGERFRTLKIRVYN